MGTSFEQFANEIRAFNARKEVINEVRKDLRKPLPEIRREVRASAKANLPASGGLGAWVAKASLTMRLKDRGRSAGVMLKLSRKSTKDKADLKRLDSEGRVRHPLYGNRKYWYQQQVTAGFFERVWKSCDLKYARVADEAFNRALDKIRRG